MSSDSPSTPAGPAQPGLLLVVSSPSGAGKTTLCQRLLAEFNQINFSVSYTTRPRRRTEVDGRDYHFVDEQRFAQMAEQGQFAEWAEVHGNHYGTSREQIERATGSGRDVLFDIDWQGARDLAAQYPDDTVMVFVLPPSIAALRERLTRRATDAPTVVERRLDRATEELRHFSDYGYLVINDQIDQAYAELRAIYLAGRCAQRRRTHFAQQLTATLDQIEPPGGGRR